jgi:hypothetical protein
MIAGVAPNPVTSADYRAAPALAVGPSPVPTDLPASQAISPAPNIPAARNDERKTAKGAADTSRAVIIDPPTDTIVFRSLNVSTGAVIDQVPAQALLRQRAYINAQAAQALIRGKDITTAEIAAARDIDTTA